MSKSLEHEDTLQSEKIYYESILNEIEPYSSQISENIKKIENENKKKNIINKRMAVLYCLNGNIKQIVVSVFKTCSFLL